MKRKQLIWLHTCYWLYIFVVFEIMNKFAYQGKLADLSR
ncbi:MAG: hypothetical protein JWQ30_378, partial [Sediminibacterium sp.]|nr:hypothetical protein [Sediminibacterium sp.]